MSLLLLLASGIAPAPGSGGGGGGGSTDLREAYNNRILETAPNGLNLTKLGIIIPKGGPGTWNEVAVEGGCIVFSSLFGKYILAAAGYRNTGDGIKASVGFYFNDDILVDPTAWYFSGLPLYGGTGIDGDPEKTGATGGTIQLVNGVFHLYTIGLTEPGYEAGVKQMCHSTSTDLVTWTRHGVIIAPNTSYTWRNHSIWRASVPVKVGSTYYMFFNADGGSGNESIGYATSTDLYTWTVDDVNSPIISRGTGWESVFVGDPSPYKIGDTWYVKYFGVGSGGASDGAATTTNADFPLNLVKYSGNPFLMPSESYDNLYAHKGSPWIEPTIHLHVYTAVASDNTRQIALAVEYL